MTANEQRWIERIRSSFPALDREVNGRPVAYFDGPGGTQVPRAVVEAMADYLFRHNANAHWAFPTSQETDEAIARARATLAAFLNATPREIVFGANMTTLTFHLSRALGQQWGPGDEIVVTELDHHANIDPWRALERERGVTVRTVKMNPETGLLDGEDLERQLNQRARLLAIGAASNALGTITDVAAAARLAREAGAQVFVDAVHYAPHRLVDVRELDCDFLACSAYKFYGPHVGILFGRHELLMDLEPPKLRPAPDSAPERWETGTPGYEGMAGAAAAVEFLAGLADGTELRSGLSQTYERSHQHGRALTERLWRGLSAIEGVRLYGPPPSEPRTPTVCFTVAGLRSAEVSRRLAEAGLFASHGDFYARTVIERLGLADQGLVRIGCACYTTEPEIDRLIEAVDHLAANPS